MAYGVSRASQYAIRALVHLARKSAADVVPVRDIAELEGIPHHFLAKVVGRLVQVGIVDAYKGPGGGLRLARPPHKTTVAQVIEAIDGPDFFEGCFLGLNVCGEDDPCPMHDEWKVLRTRLIGDIQQISIAQLARVKDDKKPATKRGKTARGGRSGEAP